MTPTVRRLRYERSLKLLGQDHPATRALWGRWAVSWTVPQRDSESIESVAWHRAAGIAGYRNRGSR